MKVDKKREGKETLFAPYLQGSYLYSLYRIPKFSIPVSLYTE